MFKKQGWGAGIVNTNKNYECSKDIFYQGAKASLSDSFKVFHILFSGE